MPPPAVSEFHSAQVRRSLAAVLVARSIWQRMPGDFDDGWSFIGPLLVGVVSSAQLAAARDGSEYVPSALAQQGQEARPTARVVTGAFAGLSASGNPLSGLLYGAVVRARTVQADSLNERLAAGQRWLDMTVHTAVADAGRDAAKVAVVARPKVQWVRGTNPPCCQRCAILAGRVYAHSEHFRRHPRCDCWMLPQTVADPDAAGLDITAGDVTDLTTRQRDLLDKGRDFNKVINDYQRKRGDFLPPTRVDQLAARRSRREAADALTQAGYLAA